MGIYHSLRDRFRAAMPEAVYSHLRPVGLRLALPNVLFSFRCDPGLANYHINISERHRYIYFEVPKTGCSTVKATLQQLELLDSDRNPPANVHDRAASPLLCPSDLKSSFARILGDGSYFRFAFVRNPYTRALSCYLNKFIGNAAERQRLAPQLGLDPAGNIEFRHVLQRIAEQPTSRMDGHWAPQADLLAPDLIQYDFIGRFEGLDNDLRDVLNRLGVTIEPERRGYTSNANRRTEEFYDGASVDLVQSIYRCDFEIFEYPLKFPP